MTLKRNPWRYFFGGPALVIVSFALWAFWCSGMTYGFLMFGPMVLGIGYFFYSFVVFFAEETLAIDEGHITYARRGRAHCVVDLQSATRHNWLYVPEPESDASMLTWLFSIGKPGLYLREPDGARSVNLSRFDLDRVMRGVLKSTASIPWGTAKNSKTNSAIVLMQGLNCVKLNKGQLELVNEDEPHEIRISCMGSKAMAGTPTGASSPLVVGKVEIRPGGEAEAKPPVALKSGAAKLMVEGFPWYHDLPS